MFRRKFRGYRTRTRRPAVESLEGRALLSSFSEVAFNPQPEPPRVLVGEDLADPITIDSEWRYVPVRR